MNVELPNYTGPYISNGSIQESVEFGDKDPKDALDALSRLHDSAYAKYKDQAHRTAADAIYEKEAKKLLAQFPQLAGDLVLYGNQILRSGSTLAQSISKWGPFGLIIGGVQNMYNLNDYMMNGAKYRKEIQEYYATDPFPNKQVYNPGSQPSKLMGEPYVGPKPTQSTINYKAMEPDLRSRAFVPSQVEQQPEWYSSFFTKFDPFGYRKRKRRRKTQRLYEREREKLTNERIVNTRMDFVPSYVEPPYNYQFKSTYDPFGYPKNRKIKINNRISAF